MHADPLPYYFEGEGRALFAASLPVGPNNILYVGAA